jgi:hypothetical protein
MRKPGNHTCLSCGEAMAPCLQRAASLRCHDCRDTNAPLRPELVEPEAARDIRSRRPQAQVIEFPIWRRQLAAAAEATWTGNTADSTPQAAA